MDDDVTVLVDDTEAYDDGTVARIRVLAVPESDRFADGVKYAFHYGAAGVEYPIIRLDNHHGPHELHLGARTFEFEFEGLAPTYRVWRAALPAEKRAGWPHRL
ncbi:MAG: DUF6516 family protein [Halorientalis sp.]